MTVAVVVEVTVAVGAVETLAFLPPPNESLEPSLIFPTDIMCLGTGDGLSAVKDDCDLSSGPNEV